MSSSHPIRSDVARAAGEQTLARVIEGARAAQRAWGERPLAARLEIIRRFRRRLADAGEAMAATVDGPWRRSSAETLAAEIIPLADACRFLEQSAARVLAPRRLGRGGRPAWLAGARARVVREPLGVVLVIGPANYPLLLPGVQAVQALVAGNAAVIKPGRRGAAAARALARELVAAGAPDALVPVLPDSAEAGRAAIGHGVDKVLVTGSLATGREILAQLAPRGVPATVELSGCDAVFVAEDADLDLVVRALVFGLTFNSGATCIAPRRVFVHRRLAGALAEALAEALTGLPPLALEAPALAHLRRVVADAEARGARRIVGETRAGCATPVVLAGATPDCELFRTDLFAPVLGLCAVADDAEALALAARCPYALGASVFGSEPAARRLAERVRAGVVVINDLIVPTADPRLPFGGRGASGFGVTRGPEGLLELTVPKSIVVRRGRIRRHYDPPSPAQARLLSAWLRAAHGGSIGGRLRAVVDLVRAGRALASRNETPEGDPS